MSRNGRKRSGRRSRFERRTAAGKDQAVLPASMVITAPVMFVKVEPPLVETCHCALGSGVPDAAAANV